MPQKSHGMASCFVSGTSIIGRIGRSPAKMLPRKNGTTALLTYSRSKWLGIVARNLCRAAERSGACRAAVPPSARLWSLAAASPATGRRAATPAPVRNVRRSILGSSLALWTGPEGTTQGASTSALSGRAAVPCDRQKSPALTRPCCVGRKPGAVAQDRDRAAGGGGLREFPLHLRTLSASIKASLGR